MSIRDYKTAIASIKARPRVVNGKEYPLFEVYLGTSPLTKKPVKLTASSIPRLKEDIAAYYSEHKESGDLITLLSPMQAMDAKYAIALLAERNCKLTLAECVRIALEQKEAQKCKSTVLNKAYEGYLNYKRKQSEAELHKTYNTVGRFVNVIGRSRQTASITLADVQSYLASNFDNRAPRTYNANLCYLRTFFRWCMKPSQRYMSEDPSASLEPKVLEWKKPSYMKPWDVEKLFRILETPEMKKEHPEYLALAVTQFFVGVRREEALRISRDSDAATILLEDETIRIEKGKGHTRGRSPRTAHIEPNAVAWMLSFDYESALNRINEETTRKLYRLAIANDIKLFSNCMRHTFITMHVAKYHTPEVTQSMVGTSGKMRAVHYDGLAPQKEGEMFFDIYPTKTAE